MDGQPTTTPPATTPWWSSKVTVAIGLALLTALPDLIDKIQKGDFKSLSAVASAAFVWAAVVLARWASEQSGKNLQAQVEVADAKASVAQDTANTAVSVAGRMPLR